MTTIVVSVGTDHHRFDRLMDWVQGWPGHQDVDLRVQRGTSRPVEGASVNEPFLPHHRLLDWLSDADGAVLQGGPGGIVDALRCGLRPIVVPRVAQFQEAVDDHQVAFCRRLAAKGLIHLAESPDALATCLDQVRPRVEAVIDLTKSFESLGPQRVAQRLDSLPETITPGRSRQRLRYVLGGTRRASADSVDVGVVSHVRV